MLEPITPEQARDVLADHRNEQEVEGWYCYKCDREDHRSPCLPYRLASAFLAEHEAREKAEAKVAAVREVLADSRVWTFPEDRDTSVELGAIIAALGGDHEQPKHRGPHFYGPSGGGCLDCGDHGQPKPEPTAVVAPMAWFSDSKYLP